MLEATRREANELYVLFSLLGHGTLPAGNAEGENAAEFPVAMVV